MGWLFVVPCTYTKIQMIFPVQWMRASMFPPVFLYWEHTLGSLPMKRRSDFYTGNYKALLMKVFKTFLFLVFSVLLYHLMLSAKMSGAFGIYYAAEQEAEILTNRMHTLVIKVYPTVALLPAVANSIFCILRGNFDAATWTFAYPVEFSFDVTTICGWYLRMIIISVGAFSYYYGTLAFIPYVYNCCAYVRACCKHFHRMFDECDEIISTKYDNEFEQIEALSEKLKGAVSLHAKIME